MGIFTKIFIWPFLCIPRVVLFITTYFGHSTTKNSLKYQIWNFAFWVDKMSQNRAIFFEIAQMLIFMALPHPNDILSRLDWNNQSSITKSTIFRLHHSMYTFIHSEVKYK